MRPSRAPRPSSNCSQFVDVAADVDVDDALPVAVAASVAVALLATFCVAVAISC